MVIPGDPVQILLFVIYYRKALRVPRKQEENVVKCNILYFTFTENWYWDCHKEFVNTREEGGWGRGKGGGKSSDSFHIISNMFCGTNTSLTHCHLMCNYVNNRHSDSWYGYETSCRRFINTMLHLRLLLSVGSPATGFEWLYSTRACMTSITKISLRLFLR